MNLYAVQEIERIRNDIKAIQNEESQKDSIHGKFRNTHIVPFLNQPLTKSSLTGQQLTNYKRI